MLALYWYMTDYAWQWQDRIGPYKVELDDVKQLVNHVKKTNDEITTVVIEFINVKTNHLELWKWDATQNKWTKIKSVVPNKADYKFFGFRQKE